MAENKRTTRKMLSRFANIFKTEKGQKSPETIVQRPSSLRRQQSKSPDVEDVEKISLEWQNETETQNDKSKDFPYEVNEAFEMEEGIYSTDNGNSDDSESLENSSIKVSKESDFSQDSGFDNCAEREIEVLSITVEEDEVVCLFLEDKPILDPRPWLMESATDEAPRDPGSSDIRHEYSERDYEGHRAHSVYVGVHIPTSHGSHGRRHRRRHHRHKHQEGEQNEHRPITPPAQRVQFLLGGEADDGTETHPLFSEMEELYVGDGDMEWRETARWIKFEEDVEEGGNRWSKPHVATLSLHSLFELRSFILHGSVLLEMDATNLEQISDLLIDNWVNSNHLTHDLKDKVRDAMLRRHRHLYEKQKEASSANINKLPLIRSLAEIGRNYSSSRSNANFSEGIQNSPSAGSISGALGDGQNGGSEHKSNLSFMKKIPPGAEASNILVGEVDFLERPVTAFVRLKEAVMLGDLTEVPVPTRFLFVLLGPTGGLTRYHEIGRAIATLMSDEVFHDVAYKGKNRDHLLAGVDEFLDAVTVLPPGEWDPSIRIEPPSNIPSQDQRKHPKEEKVAVNEEEEEQRIREEMGLKRSGRPFGGLINDIKRKAPWYFSDYKDALALQSIASYIFLYFACLTPIITFGGLLGEATQNRMAAIESLVAGFVCGSVYGFFSGQPLTILGSTGPVLVFETILFDFCHRNELDYLSFRLWIGIWVGLILVILVATDASYLVSYITRFTEENFATLIAFIFIYKAIEKLLKIGSKHAINPPEGWPFVYEGCMCNATNNTISPETYNWSAISKEDCSKFNGVLWGLGCDENYYKYEPNVFLMSAALFSGTFIISVIFKDFKFSLFFPTKVRQVVSDFAVIIAIISMTGIDYAVGVHTPKLEVPEELKPTWKTRTWLIPLFGHEGQNPWWTSIAAVVPALLATILIFMDQQITAVIVNRKENKLKKGCGYHLDLFILSILIVICSIMGLPWFVAATVLSINHVNSLKLETECAAPGEKPQFLGVRENRVTHILIFVTIGLSVLLTPLLKCIPMPVLFGVFLYMGVSSLKGLQFFDRILIIFMPVKWQPDYMFLRLVPLKRVHLFTAIQMACLIVLWVIKSFKSTSILFPIMLVFMIGVRKALDKVFSIRELKALDDIMPDFHRKKKYEEEQKEFEEFDEKPPALKSNMSGNFQIPLANGNVIKIPVDSINISEEMNKSGVWKHLESEQTSPTHVQSNGTAASKRHTGKEAMNEDETKRLSILEEDEEDHGITITVDPKKGKDDETSV